MNALIVENIPAELRRLKRWVNVRLEKRPKADGGTETTKVPYQPSGRKAQSTNAGTWVTFEEAIRANGFDGIGFVLGDGITGIDLDHCVENGVIEDWAQVIIDSFASYTEFSISGTGIHILIRGQVPDGLKGRRKGAIECYSEGRYFTVSARPVPGTPGAVESRQDELTAFFRRCFPPPETAKPRPAAPRSALSLSDGELLDKAMNATNGAAFSQLWNGDTSGHNGDDSAADLALCCHLAFHWDCDAGAIDRMFRQSGLYREKWERLDYRERTISKALAVTTETYRPPGVPLTITATGAAKKTAKPRRQEEPTAAVDPGDDWEAPIPFGQMDLPAFPMEALPAPLGEFVREVAESTQVPPALPAMLGLTAVGACAGRRAEIAIGSTHTEPLNVFAAVVLPPGSRKSSALEAIFKPLREAEWQAARQKKPEVEAAKERREMDTKRLSYLRDRAAKELKEVERRALEDDAAYLAAHMTEVPALPRLLADDITMERLSGLLSEQPDNSIAIVSAEGGIFGILAGRYSNGAANLDLLLKGHGGEAFISDRVGRPLEYVQRPTITIGLAVQPDVLESLADNASFRGRGLLGRFLYALPPDLVGSREYQDRPVCPRARMAYVTMIDALLALPLPEGDGPGRRHRLRLEGEALAIWKRYHDHVERQQAEGEPLSQITDWASKLAGAVARIAGSLHLVKHAQQEAPWEISVEPETVAAAWAIGEYLIPHARAAFGKMGADPTRELAGRVTRWITRKKLTAFKFSDCYRIHQNVTTPEKLEMALALLCDHAFIRVEEQPARAGAGRKPKPLYAVNPGLQKAQTGE